MRTCFFLPFLASAALFAQTPAPKAEPKPAPKAEAKAESQASAEIKVGTGVEKMEIQGESASFKVPAGTKIYAWTKVTGAGDSTVTVVFSKGERTSKQELKVPHSPYRTNAYRTFRAGDGGDWTVKVLSADGAELGTAAFTVEIE
ncbi:DUF2914 domain-containing protein [Geothrix fuzhouensis]|uniref:DUF2914 domain-containing protein n=1 Tax=Geothrix fuzhouensis TaxID=2966451 RepID=UPI0021479B14|nr:DUF2914 domain-containing protein [Geothrix fuzhouensis]